MPVAAERMQNDVNRRIAHAYVNVGPVAAWLWRGKCYRMKWPVAHEYRGQKYARLVFFSLKVEKLAEFWRLIQATH